MLNRPRPHEGVVVEQLDDELCLFDAAAAEVLVLNTSASAIWKLFDGQRTVDEVCRILARQHELDLVEISSQVEDLIAQLSDRGLLVEASETDAT